MKNKQRGFIVPFLITIIAIIAVGGGLYYTQSKQKASRNNTYNETSSWKTYKNDKYGFKFMYPADIFQEPKEIIGTDIPGTPNFLKEIRFCLKGADKEIFKNELCGKNAEGDTFYGPLTVRFDRDGEYTTYYRSSVFYRNSPQSKKIQIDNRDAYIPLNSERNDIELLRLTDPYFISGFDLNKYKDTCTESPIECGLVEIDDVSTKNIFNQIISTIKFY
jgi:hypothetical protein